MTLDWSFPFNILVLLLWPTTQCLPIIIHIISCLNIFLKVQTFILRLFNLDLWGEFVVWVWQPVGLCQSECVCCPVSDHPVTITTWSQSKVRCGHSQHNTNNDTNTGYSPLNNWPITQSASSIKDICKQNFVFALKYLCYCQLWILFLKPSW